MAEEYNEPTPETNESNPPMDKGDDTPVSQTTECIQNYRENPLEGLIKLSVSEETVACIDYKGKINNQEYKLCKLIKAKDIHKEYFGIKNTISTTFFKQVCLIDENVDAILTKTEAVNAALNSSLDAIKNAKSKLWEVREAACKLDGARNDSCNSEQLSALSKIPADQNGLKGIARFQALVDKIKEDAFKLYDSVDDVFEKGVKVAGIQAYMNTASIKEFTTALKTDAEAFSEDVIANLAYSDELIDTAQEAFTEGLQELDVSLFAKTNAHLTHTALENMDGYAEHLEEEACIDRTADLEQVCEDIKNVFQSQINCPT